VGKCMSGRVGEWVWGERGSVRVDREYVRDCHGSGCSVTNVGGPGRQKRKRLRSGGTQHNTRTQQHSQPHPQNRAPSPRHHTQLYPQQQNTSANNTHNTVPLWTTKLSWRHTIVLGCVVCGVHTPPVSAMCESSEIVSGYLFKSKHSMMNTIEKCYTSTRLITILTPTSIPARIQK
jgi:hypothetical protein